MLEKPNLDDDAIVSALRSHYALDVAALEFLPIGNDVGSYVYRVATRDDSTYFLKARRAPMYEPSVVVPHYLREQGIHQVVAPLPTRSGALWAPLHAFNLILYPYIEARTGMDAGLTVTQWGELGRTLRALHTLDPPPHIRRSVVRESFDAPYWVAQMRRLQGCIDGAAWRDAIDAELAAFWTHRRDQMYALMERTLSLGRELHTTPRPFVLCHSDIHTANVLVEPNGALYIVDWDQPVFAPKERDLMFFGAGLGSLTGGAGDAVHFYEGYGPTAIDRTAFTYYRYAWVMQDWVACGAEVLLHDELGELTRRNSLRSFVAMFAPGNVVDVAYASDDLRGTG